MLPAPQQQLLETAQVIRTVEALEAFLGEVRGCDVFAVDTESAGFYKYYAVVNLVQISTRTHAAILDPQAVKDLSPLKRFAEQSTCEWIFHGGDYDLRMLARDFQVHVKNVFDTRIAAELCGLEHLSLSSLAEAFLGVKLDKKLQRCDWSRRPLTPDMIRYGLLDAICLVPIRDRLSELLREKQRFQWAKEEFQHLEEILANPAPPQTRPFPFLIKGSNRLSPRSLAVLKEVWEFRERISAEIDRAPYMVLSNQALLEIARMMPLTAVGLSVVPCMGRDFFNRYGRDVLEAVKRGSSGPPFYLPRPTRDHDHEQLSSWEGELAKAMREAREKVAVDLGMSGPLLAPNHSIEELAREKPNTPEAFFACRALRRWQAEQLVQVFLPILQRPMPIGSPRKRRRRRRPGPGSAPATPA